MTWKKTDHFFARLSAFCIRLGQCYQCKRCYFSDYFFESMILLKHAFCWEWIDVLYFVTNQRADHKELSEDLSKKIIEWNNIDQKIVEMANSTFWSKYNEIPNLELLEDEFQIEIGEDSRSTKLILILNIMGKFEHKLRKGEAVLSARSGTRM